MASSTCGNSWQFYPLSAASLSSIIIHFRQAQEVLRGCELLESPAGAALVASMGHLQREQGNLEGQSCESRFDGAKEELNFCWRHRLRSNEVLLEQELWGCM